MKIEERKHPRTDEVFQIEVFPFLAEDEESRLTSASLTVDFTEKYIRNGVNGGNLSVGQARQLQTAYGKAIEILEAHKCDRCGGSGWVERDAKEQMPCPKCGVRLK